MPENLAAEIIEPIRTTYISFVECELRGGWDVFHQDPEIFPDDKEHDIYIALGHGDSELWLVQSGGLRRAFNFKSGAEVRVGQSMVRFEQDEVEEELAVDEDKQQGK